MKDITVVIVNYKMKDKIDICLTSLFADLVGTALDVHIVVVDNNSGDDIRSFLAEKFPTVVCIEQSANVGFGKSQNLGMRSCEAKYYFVLNPDTEFHVGQKTLERLYMFMEQQPKIGMIGPKLLYPTGSLQYSCWRFPTFFQPLYQRTKLGSTQYGQKCIAFHHMKDFDHNKTIPVDALMGSAMFVRREAVEQVGMFDERFFMYYEDIDWSRRMWEKHWPVYYVHDVVLNHSHGRGSAAVPGIFRALYKNKLARIHVRSWLQYLWKWKSDRYFSV